MQQTLTDKYSYLDTIAGIVLCTAAGGMIGLLVVLGWLTFALLGAIGDGPGFAVGFSIWGIFAATGAVVGWKLIPKYAAPRSGLLIGKAAIGGKTGQDGKE